MCFAESHVLQSLVPAESLQTKYPAPPAPPAAVERKKYPSVESTSGRHSRSCSRGNSVEGMSGLYSRSRSANKSGIDTPGHHHQSNSMEGTSGLGRHRRSEKGMPAARNRWRCRSKSVDGSSGRHSRS